MKKILQVLCAISILSILADIFFFPVWSVFVSLFLGIVMGIALLVVYEKENKASASDGSPIMEAHDKARDLYAERLTEGKTPGQRFPL